jgi:MFS family permease
MTQSTTRDPRHREDPGDLPRRLAWALGSGTVLQGLNSAVIAVALVPIALQFGASDAIPWLVSGLYIAAAVGAPTGGRLADLFGARRLYLVGLVIVLLASVAGPFMPTVEWLIVDRVVLGLGTSIQFPAAMAIIRRQASLSGRGAVGAIGIVALCGQTTAALGPTLGGLVIGAVGWQGIFWVNVPLVLNSALWLMLVVPADERKPRRGLRSTVIALDLPGMLLFVVALVLLMSWLLGGNSVGAAWMVIAVVALTAMFTVRERAASSPFVDLRVLAAHPQIALTCLRAVVTFVSFYCVFYGLPQWLQSSRDLDPAMAGLLMLPVFAIGVLSTFVATRIGRRARPRVLLAVGTAAMVLAGTMLAFFVDEGSPIVILVVVAALLGVPNGFNNLGNQLLLHGGSPSTAAGSASGLYRTAQYLGACISTVVVARTLDVGSAAGGIASLGLWIAGLGGFLLITNLIAMLVVRRRASDKGSET